MVRFGIVGTNWITEKLINAGGMLENFKLNAVYSRSEEKWLSSVKHSPFESTPGIILATESAPIKAGNSPPARP